MLTHFKKFEDGSIVALFAPWEIDEGPRMVQSYMHVGQHGTASADLFEELEDATPEEFAALLAELQSIYDGEIVPMNNRIFFDPRYGWLWGEIPAACVDACSASGDVSASVSDWVKRLSFEPPRALAISYLSEFGAWDDLETATPETLAERVLWIACGDISEQGEWSGLV